MYVKNAALVSCLLSLLAAGCAVDAMESDELDQLAELEGDELGQLAEAEVDEGELVDDSTREKGQYIWEAGCLTATPDRLDTDGIINGYFTGGYHHANPTCYKTFIYELRNSVVSHPPNGAYTPGGWHVYTPGSAHVTWAAADLYIKNANGSWSLVERQERTFPGPCSGSLCIDKLIFDIPMARLLNNRTYRLMATSRSSRSGTTKPLRFHTTFPALVH